MVLRRHGLIAATVGCAAFGCPDNSKDLLYEPVPLEAHEVKVVADAEGDARAPAHVSVFLQRGELHLSGGGRHTLEGVATGGEGDPPPRVELMQDRVALAQSHIGGSPPRADAKYVLSLGPTPMSLEIDTGKGEVQVIDLGGVPVKQASFHTEAGHLAIDWSAANPLAGAPVTLRTEAGYIEVTHLGRSGAARVDVSDVAGFVSLDVGDLAAAAPEIAISAQVTSGMFVLKVPKALPTRVLTSGGLALTRKGFVQSPDGSFASGDPASARVTVHVTSTAGKIELAAE